MSSPAVLDPTPVCAPEVDVPSTLIPPVMAQVLNLAKHSGVTLTPKELNEQLAQVLERYDTLTASFAQTSGRIREDMAALKHGGSALAGQLNSLNADLQRQGSSVAVLAASTSADIQAVQREVEGGLADVEERVAIRLETMSASVGRDVSRLGTGIHSLGQLLDGQERIIQEQIARLDQFDVARELLDTAVRGNRKRIEAVREELDWNHTVVTAQVQGLAALHREHYAEFNELRHLVETLRSDAQQLDKSLQGLGARVAGHVEMTRRRFRWTHTGIATTLVLSLAGFAAVKWLPAFAPEQTLQTARALTHARSDIDRLDSQVAGLPALEFRTSTQEIQVSQMSRNVATLKQGLAEMQQALRELHAQRVDEVVPAAMSVSPGLNDASWVMAQAPSAYTVQLAGVADVGELKRLVRQFPTGIDGLGAHPLSYSITYPAGQERYNLFYGVFESAEAARAAISELPQAWQAKRPWVRQWQAIQAAAR